ncbi:MAG: LssY C-terminal domain-containing protein [Burkholderiales bacterium]
MSFVPVALQLLALLLAAPATPASSMASPAMPTSLIASRVPHQDARLASSNQTAVLPAGSHLQLRLTSALSSATSRSGDRVSAVLTVDAAASGLVVPAGTIVRGVVRQAAAFSWSTPQALLWLDFRELLSVSERRDESGRSIPIVTRVVAVDNARETVDQDGRILGITPPREAPSSAEGAVLLAALAPELYDFARAEFSFRELERPDIVYAAGTDFVLETLTATRDVPAVAARADPMPDRELLAIAAAQPLRTSAGTPPRPADVINLVFSASEVALQHAFNTAGWNTAVALGLRADVKTVLAVAVDRGYKLGPVSLQSLNGRRPDHVFQKQTNTFDRRHHIRIWRATERYQGQPVWAASATHDIGIKFVREERTFTHRVEQVIDLERQKIVDDLRYTGSVVGYALERRPGVPTQLTNATEDVMTTDGKVAVIVLRPR